MLHEAAGQFWWWHDLKTMICLRGSISGIFILGAFLFCIFCFAGFSNGVKWWSVFVCCIVFWVQKLCCLSTYANWFFFCQLPFEKIHVQIRLKRVFVCLFFCSIESEGDDANIFVSVFCFYLFDYFGSSKLIFTWLKTSRLLWQLWKGVQSTRTAVLSQIVFFWMNNLMMKFKSFCLLDAYCGRGSTHSVTHAH